MNLDERLQDIRTNPEQHRHDWDGLSICCMVNGAFHTQLLDAHQGAVERLERPWQGRKCDVESGPCACGGWH